MHPTTVTNQASSDRLTRQAIHRLESAAKEVSAATTQTIAAANAARHHLPQQKFHDALVNESVEASKFVAPLVQQIKESQAARSYSEQIQSQSGLIYGSKLILQPAYRLVDASRNTVPHVEDKHSSNVLLTSSNQLSINLAELRTAISTAEQLNFDSHLEHSDEITRDLSYQIQQILQDAKSNQLEPSEPGLTRENATTTLKNACRCVGSSVAQLISSANSTERQHIVGASSLELVHSLHSFVKAVRDVAVTIRKDDKLTERLIFNAQSVVQDCGLVFNRVREGAHANQLDESFRAVQQSIKNTLSCLPDSAEIEFAIRAIREISFTPADFSVENGFINSNNGEEIRHFARQLINSCQHLSSHPTPTSPVIPMAEGGGNGLGSENDPISPRQSATITPLGDFVRNYLDFHTVVLQRVAASSTTTEKNKEHRNQQQIGQDLRTAQSDTLEMLERLRAQNSDQANVVHLQALSQSAQAFVHSVNRIVDRLESFEASDWVRECDNALQQIQPVRYLFTSLPIVIPLNQNSYYESLTEVTKEARNLGDGINAMTHYARLEDTGQMCSSMRKISNALCSLAQNTAQSAYLVGVGDPQSEPGRVAIYNSLRFNDAFRTVKQLGKNIIANLDNKSVLLNDTTSIASQASTLASLCRDASDASSNMAVRSQFVNFAKEMASTTASLIKSVKKYDKSLTNENRNECKQNAEHLLLALENLDKFVDNPEFGPIPARISPAGCQAQQPLVTSVNQMLDASLDMIQIAMDLEGNPFDTAIWQEISTSTSEVSDSIKTLVSLIRDGAPGQVDLDKAIELFQQLNHQIDAAAISTGQQELAGPDANEQHVHQQILYSAQQSLDKIDPLKIAAISHAEAIGRIVRHQMTSTQNLVLTSITASTLSYNSRTQMKLLEQCKTVIEASVQMMLATKDTGGNPKAVQLHTYVEQSAEQLRNAIADLQRTVQILQSEAGIMVGIMESLSRSVALIDQITQPPPDDSFADAQVRMVEELNEIMQFCADISLVGVQQLGQLFLHLSESFKRLAENTRIVQSLNISANSTQKVKTSVQKLGTICIEMVKLGGQCQSHPTDSRLYQQLVKISQTVQDRVREVLAFLSEGSRGTQACINAAQTVSGVIGDLDTAIMFATSGSLIDGSPPPSSPQNTILLQHGHQHYQPPSTSQQVSQPWQQQQQQRYQQRQQSSVPPSQQTFNERSDVIVRIAQALIEDTKALVSGAASNQEQLAVAAQNAVRTILQLTESVKGSAATLSADSVESQVMVIHAVRDVAAALSNLIQATTHASGRNPNDPAITNLKDAAKVMVGNVGSLLRTIKTVEDSTQRGAQALEAAVDAIDVAIGQYDSVSSLPPTKQPSSANADEIVRATCSVTAATTRASSAASSLYHEQIVAAANLGRQSISELLRVTKSVASVLETPELKYKMLNCGRDVALQLKHLLSTLQKLLARPGDINAEKAIMMASQEIAKGISELAQCTESLRTTNSSSLDHEENVLAAENELFGATKSIEDAAQKISQINPRSQNKADEKLDYDEKILSLTKSITSAAQTFVKAASGVQHELVSQGLVDPNPALATDDYQWSEWVVSAARSVAVAVHQLCEAANGIVLGHSTDERLVSAAKQVASSTAHLLVACRVRSDMNSRSMQRLQSAGHAIKTATEHLVNAVRRLVTEDEKQALIISDRMVSGIAQVMDAQETVLRKEKELVEARNRLAQINKSRYEKSPEPQ